MVKSFHEDVEALKQGMTELGQEGKALKQTNGALEQKNTALERDVEALKQKNAALEQKNAALEQKNAELDQDVEAPKQENVSCELRQHMKDTEKRWEALFHDRGQRMEALYREAIENRKRDHENTVREMQTTQAQKERAQVLHRIEAIRFTKRALINKA
jgi:chromosome segregation ATPase